MAISLLTAAIATWAPVLTGGVASTIFGLGAFGSFLARAALGLALNALAPKPRSSAPTATGYLVTQSGTALDHQIVYGRTRVGGVRVFDATTGDDNGYLHRVIAFTGHEIESFDEIWINDAKVTSLAADGNVAEVLLSNGIPSNLYDGKIRIKRHLGSPDQTADADLVSEVADWTTDHRLRGVSYLYIRLSYDQDTFPNGVPEITATIKGKKVFDPRTSTTAWSDNPALCLRDYITSGYGLGASAQEIDDPLVILAANVCDETVPVENTTRYTCNGAFTTNQTPYDVLSLLTTSMGGLFWYAQGKWRMKPAYWVAPTLTLDEDDLRSNIQVSTRHSRRDNFNIVRGTFRGEESDWQITDYPEVSNPAYLTADNGQESVADISLPFTDSSLEARRIARIALERNRQQITVMGSFGLKAFQCQVGDIINLSSQRFGWTNKSFEVVAWTFGLTDDLDLQVQMTLREITQSVFDEVDDGVVYERDNTTLATPFLSVAPQNFVVSDGGFTTDDGSYVNSFIVSWDRPSDAFVDFYVLEWRVVGDSKFKSVNLKTTEYQIAPVLSSQTYEIRVKAVNTLGVSGPYVTTTFAVGGDATAPGLPTNLSAAGAFKYITISWDNPADSDLNYIEIYENTVNTSSGSNLVGTTSGNSFVRTGLGLDQTRWYFLRAVDYSGNRSGFTTGVSATTTFLDDPDFENGIYSLFTSQGLYAIEDVATLPASGQFIGQKVYNQVDGKLYSWTGTEWETAVTDVSVDFADLTGQLQTAQIAVDAVTNAVIANDAVQTENIANLAITAAKVQDNAVTTAKIAASAVTAGELANNAVTQAKIQDLAINAAKIADNAVSTTKIADNAIIEGKIATNAVTQDKIQDLAVNATKIANSAVTTAKIAASAVTAGELANNAVTQAKIQDLAITAAKVQDNAVTTAKIADSAVAQAKIASNAVSSEKITTGAVTETKIAANAVTEAKVASNAITTAKIADAAIAEAKLATNAVTSAKIATDAITTTKIAPDAITTPKIAAGAITASEIASNAVTAAKITSGAVTTAKLAAGAVTANEIAANAITSSKIAAGEITASKLYISGNSSVFSDVFESTLSLDDWVSYNGAGETSIVTSTISNAGGKILRVGNNSGNDQWWAIHKNNIAFDPNVTYRLRLRARRSVGLGTMYFGWAGVAADGVTLVNLSGANTPSSQHYHGASAVSLPTTFTEYTGYTRGYGATAGTSYTGSSSNPSVMHPDVRYIRPLLLVNYNATNGITEIDYFNVDIMSDSNLIVDGGITSSKITSNAITSDKISAGAVTATQIASNAITSDKIAAGTITASDIAAGTITGAKIAANTLTAGNIAANAITASELATNAVTAVKIAADAITTAKIAAGAVTATEIAAGTITGDKVAANTLTAGNIAANAITASELATNSVTAVKIAADSVTTAKIAAGAVTAAEIAGGTITGDKVAANTLTAGNIAAGAITASELATDSVTAAKIAAGAVTASEIATNAITAAKISAGAVTAGKIAANAVTATEIAADAVTTAKIAAGAITATEIASDAITTAKIAAGAITATEIASNAITSAKIAAGTITASDIAANTITGANIAGNTITGNKITANTITGGLLATSGIITGSAQINNGLITNAKIANLAVTNAKIANATITGAKIASATIGTANIANAAITDAKISNLSADKINAGTIAVDYLPGLTSINQTITTSNVSLVSYGAQYLITTTLSGIRAGTKVIGILTLNAYSTTSDGPGSARTCTMEIIPQNIAGLTAHTFNKNNHPVLGTSSGFMPMQIFIGTGTATGTSCQVQFRLGTAFGLETATMLSGAALTLLGYEV